MATICLCDFSGLRIFLSEVKQRRAWLVLGWVTVWELNTIWIYNLNTPSLCLQMCQPLWWAERVFGLITQVKQRRAWLATGWVTAWKLKVGFSTSSLKSVK